MNGMVGAVSSNAGREVFQQDLAQPTKQRFFCSLNATPAAESWKSRSLALLELAVVLVCRFSSRCCGSGSNLLRCLINCKALQGAPLND